VQLTHEPGSPTEDDIERLRGAGLSDAAVHDAIQVIAYFNYINRVADAVGIEGEPEWTSD
jgi:alkylhydroperoxidase family enzyme